MFMAQEAQRKAPVELVLDSDQGFENSRAPTDVQTILLVMRMLVGLGVESLDGEREPHDDMKRTGAGDEGNL
jgi:hypothetical protein